MKFQVRNQDAGARAQTRGRITEPKKGLQGVSSQKEEGIFQSKEGVSMLLGTHAEGAAGMAQWAGSAGGVTMSSALQTDRSLPGIS